MTDNNQINSKHLHDSTYGCKYSNLSLYSVNLSLIANISSLVAQVNSSAKKCANLGVTFSDVTPVITHFLVKALAIIAPITRAIEITNHRLDINNFDINRFTTHCKKRYYGVLSKNVSGQASRYLLAFFVPDNSPASQAVTIRSSTTLKAHLGALREYSLISKVNTSPTDYDGLTLQNKIAERRICRAVTNVTESKTRHPIPLLYSVALTQKTLGAIHHG